MSNDKTLIVIVGATGSGKTDLSIQIAKHYNTHIISTDSRQIYRGMAIGTAQPTQEQLNEVPHHLINCRAIEEHYTCGRYENDAISTLNDLFKTHSVVVAVGGSGLYIDALCNGIDSMPDADLKLRQDLNLEFENTGIESLLERLSILDPIYYNIVDKSNKQRVIRALEVCIQSGLPYSSFREGNQSKRDFKIIKIGITMDRAKLYDRINRRVDIMISDGLEVEAKALYPYRELNSLQTVGYRELFSHFSGECSLEDAIELIKRNSRRYAKRQGTWFKRDNTITWTPHNAITETIEYIDNQLNK